MRPGLFEQRPDRAAVEAHGGYGRPRRGQIEGRGGSRLALDATREGERCHPMRVVRVTFRRRRHGDGVLAGAAASPGWVRVGKLRASRQRRRRPPRHLPGSRRRGRSRRWIRQARPVPVPRPDIAARPPGMARALQGLVRCSHAMMQRPRTRVAARPGIEALDPGSGAQSQASGQSAERAAKARTTSAPAPRAGRTPCSTAWNSPPSQARLRTATRIAQEGPGPAPLGWSRRASVSAALAALARTSGQAMTGVLVGAAICSAKAPISPPSTGSLIQVAARAAGKAMGDRIGDEQEGRESPAKAMPTSKAGKPRQQRAIASSSLAGHAGREAREEQHQRRADQQRHGHRR